jgi:hypothetical protein
MIVADWSEEFKAISVERLNEAMERVSRSFVPTAACPFPVQAHVWEVLNDAKSNEDAVVAEAAWQKALHWSRNDWHPDVAISRIRNLDPQIRRALGAAGGPAHLFGCSEEETQWARKRFIEAYQSLERLQEDENFISDSEAKKILYETIPNAMKRLA